MAPSPIRILLVEDNPGDARLLSDMLGSASDSPFEVVNAKRLEEATALLEQQNFGAVILDLGLPDSKGLSTVDKARDSASEQRVPIVVVTGLVDEREAFHAVHHGAQDFLLKNNLSAANLIRTIRFAIERQLFRNQVEDADAQQRHDNEMRSLENLSAANTSLVTARAYGMQRLREASPDTFDLLVDQYGEMIEQAVEQRAFKVDRKVSQGLRVLAQRLGFLRAGPRDVVEIHTASIKKELDGKQFRRVNVLTQEAHLLLVEVMGYLAAYYRDHMVPASPARPSAPLTPNREQSGEKHE